jgi:hypothetical protein
LRNNYVLIDHENVQPNALDALKPSHFKVFVFVGASQTRIPIDVASVMQAKGPDARYVRMSGSGKNALDFHVAYYIGRLASQDPEGFFHVISRDAGFDPLIAHLKHEKIFAARSASRDAMPCFKASVDTADEERIAAVVADLRKRGSALPRSAKALANTINTVFGNKLEAAAVQRLIEALERRGLVVVNDGQVTYALEAAVPA